MRDARDFSRGRLHGSPFDKIWSVGVDYRDERVDDESQWNGINLLGKTLDRVREELIQEES